MKIRSNYSELLISDRIAQNIDATSASMSRLSSGTRITRSADDAAGLNIANKLRSDTRGFRVALQNIEEVTSILSIAEGAANALLDIMMRMKDLATQAASNNAAGQRVTLDDEFQMLKEEVLRVATSAKYQGDSVFGFSSKTFQVGVENDANSRLTFSLGNPLGLYQLDTAITGDLLTHNNAVALITYFDDIHLQRVNEGIGTIGALQSRLGTARSAVEAKYQGYLTAESALRDVDLARETTELTKSQVIQQSSMAMLGQANLNKQNVLNLLLG